MRVPPIPNSFKPEQVMFLRDVLNQIVQELGMKVGRLRAVDSFSLVSPSGKVYTVTVDDAGTLTTTLAKE